jgi:XRE family aerobic/anaerobic benzoate catabolism transcriptional regulator
METTLGERIRARRQRAQWKLKDLAKETGLSVPYLSDLERDQGANPTLETLRTIATALGCDLTELLADGGGQPGNDVPLSVSLQRFVDSTNFSNQIQRLAQRLNRPADEELRSQVVNFLANAPRRSSGELSKTDWNQILDFYMVIADR